MKENVLTKSLSLSQNAYQIIGILIVLVYYLPFLIFGENTYVHVHDILDIDVAHTKMLIDQNAIYNYNQILPILDGIPRSEYFICFSPYDFKMLFYNIMPTFWAYLTNSMLVRLLAFLGMYWLLNQYILKKENTKYYNFIAFACSIIFALIPFYTTFGLSSAGLPLLTWAFLNLKEKKNLVISYITIAFFANYSCLALSGVFACIVFGCYYIYIAIKNKNLEWHILIGLCILGMVYLLTNIDLFIHTLFNRDYVSQREDFNIPLLLGSLKDDVKTLFYYTQYHSGTLHTKPIIYVVLIAIISQLRIDNRLRCVLGSIAIVFIIYIGVRILKTNLHVPFVQAFGFDRFYFFLPFLWIVSLAIALEILANKINIVLVLFLLLPFVKNAYNTNDELKSVVHQLKGKEPYLPTYKQFYDEDLFANITQALNVCPNTTKVVSIGLFPSIAEYNGYHTLDSYINIYPLNYKRKFRKVIAPELDKSKELREYYDYYGSRVYMFSSEIKKVCEEPYMIKKSDSISISPQYNIGALKELGANFVFSAAKLNNATELGLIERSAFTTDESLWRIYVYELK